MRIVASVEIERWNVGGYDPDDRWSRDSTEGRINEVTARPLRDNEPARAYYYSDVSEEAELDVNLGDIVYVVAAGYYTGDTFGSDYDGAVIAVFKESWEAVSLVSALRPAKSHSVEHEGVSYRVPWWGYFEHLDRLDVYPVVLGGM